jgi:hypothetical protein
MYETLDQQRSRKKSPEFALEDHPATPHHSPSIVYFRYFAIAFSSIGRVVSSLVCSVARAAIDSNPARQFYFNKTLLHRIDGLYELILVLYLVI